MPPRIGKGNLSWGHAVGRRGPLPAIRMVCQGESCLWAQLLFVLMVEGSESGCSSLKEIPSQENHQPSGIPAL